MFTLDTNILPSEVLEPGTSSIAWYGRRGTSMADRKVLVKYYPPDFDPEKLAQKGWQYRNCGNRKKAKTGVSLMNVRFMFPFTMCCGMCNEFIYIGTKFNSRVEKIKNEEYLGIPIWRFYGRCPNCRNEIAFKTDPKHTEYVLESGGTRAYDPRKDAALAETTLKEQMEDEMATDVMKALEFKTHNAANELQALEQLNELRKINKRLLSREAIVDEALAWLRHGGLHEKSEQELDESDLQEFREAKIEMDKLQLKRTLDYSSDSSDSDSASAKAPQKNPPQNVKHAAAVVSVDEDSALKSSWKESYDYDTVPNNRRTRNDATTKEKEFRELDTSVLSFPHGIKAKIRIKPRNSFYNPAMSSANAIV